MANGIKLENPGFVKLYEATAKTIAEVGQVIINSAKVECDFMKVLGMDSSFSGFIPQNNDQKKLGNEQ
jgi:hypothetical protein